MPVPPGFVHCAFIFTGAGAGPGGCMTTVAFSHIVTESPTELAQEMGDAFGSEVMDNLTGDVEMIESRIRIGTSEGDILASAFGSWPGAVGGNACPPSVAWPLLKFTASGGRKNRGRMFLPGVPEGAVDSAGAIEGAAADAMNDSITQWLVEAADADCEPALLHSDPDDDPTPIIAITSGALSYTRGTRLRG